MKALPYLDFDGVCDEAIEFYKSATGAKVTGLMRFAESPAPCPDMTPEIKKKVMHASIQIGDSTLFASDGRCQNKRNFHGIALAIDVPTDADAERVFAALSVGGTVNMPLTKTFFSSRFGMLNDRFGVGWMVMVQP